MLQNEEREWDEVKDEKISFGDRVDTDLGEGMVTELDGETGEYLVFTKHDQEGHWFKREELKLIK